MSDEPLVIKPGVFVRPVVPECRRADATVYGRVSMIRRCSTLQGTETEIFVRWYDANGEPRDHSVQMQADDIVLIESEVRHGDASVGDGS